MADRRRYLPGMGVIVAAIGLVCVVCGLAIWQAASPASQRGLDPGSPSLSPSTPVTTGRSPDGVSDGERTERALPSPAGCAPADGPFRPHAVRMPWASQATKVVAAHRDVRGVPGVPPLTDTGKRQFAWDAGGIRPGAPAGHVLMNAHTYPDGTALGNELLRQLDAGDVLAVEGARGQRLCYRVGERIVAPFPDTPPAVLDRYYATVGRPELAIVVCSGRRSGPGTWTQRTLWFAQPVSRAG